MDDATAVNLFVESRVHPLGHVLHHAFRTTMTHTLNGISLLTKWRIRPPLTPIRPLWDSQKAGAPTRTISLPQPEVPTRTRPRNPISRAASHAVLLLIVCALCAICPPIRATAQANQQTDLRSRAEAARTQGDLPAALTLYQQAVAEDPRWLDGWWFLGNLQYQTDRYAEAGNSLDQFLALSPNAPAALALRGLCRYETAAYDDSLADIQHAIALGAANNPRNGKILLYHEALLLTRTGRFDEAIAKYTAFLKQESTSQQGTANPELAAAFGLAGLRMPLLPQEIPAADQNLVALTGEAASKIVAGDIAAGRQSFANILTQYPGRPSIHYFCGYLLFTASPDDAIAEFKLELAVTPKSPLAHAMLAWASELRGDFTQALPDAQAAVAEDPSSAMSQLVLGKALAESGTDAAGSLPHLDQVVASEPNNIEAHLSLVKAYSKLGRNDDARRERLLCMQLANPDARPAPAGSDATP